MIKCCMYAANNLFNVLFSIRNLMFSLLICFSTFQELAPLLLPLILGEEECEINGEEEEKVDDDDSVDDCPSVDGFIFSTNA